ncbi:hypothetical protein J7E73_30555 [Paenibacillus albidus]|uniref:hypothetical protein n=1 Tax=Paenibacillus albidus TaxID=2041023 RepID=UPI001BE69EA7|nr:hypothetical protein [Paenibacillus albidus]MBT2293359.1 hypothetical protein [Paenibacillus albidus]
MCIQSTIHLGEDEGDSYSYQFVHDWPTYQCCMKELSGQGYSIGMDLLNSYTKVEIGERGNIHIVY